MPSRREISIINSQCSRVLELPLPASFLEGPSSFHPFPEPRFPKEVCAGRAVVESQESDHAHFLEIRGLPRRILQTASSPPPSVHALWIFMHYIHVPQAVTPPIICSHSSLGPARHPYLSFPFLSCQ